VNKNQKIILSVGILVFVIIGLFPPPVSLSGSLKMWERKNFILTSHRTIDRTKLAAYWLLTAVETGGIIYLLKGSKGWNMEKFFVAIFWIFVAFVLIIILVCMVASIRINLIIK